MVARRPLSHRPTLNLRFWIYSSVAYLTPVVLQIMFPADTGFADELVWLITLVPAFLLSLHYGLRGALAGLVMGTVLFAVVQSVVAMNFTPTIGRSRPRSISPMQRWPSVSAGSRKSCTSSINGRSRASAWRLLVRRQRRFATS